jgi:hypothetical protein
VFQLCHVQVGALLRTAGRGGCAGLVNAQVQRFLADVYVSLQAPRCAAQAALDSVADVACQLCHSRGRETSLLLCDGCHRGYHRAGTIIGAVSPQLCLKCQMVSGIVRIASRVTRPLHSTFPAGNGARAHGLRAKAGAPFLSFFLLCAYKSGLCFSNKPTTPLTSQHTMHTRILQCQFAKYTYIEHRGLVSRVQNEHIRLLTWLSLRWSPRFQSPERARHVLPCIGRKCAHIQASIVDRIGQCTQQAWDSATAGAASKLRSNKALKFLAKFSKGTHVSSTQPAS